MEKKKICILTSVHPAFDTRIFHRQAKSLVRAGYDVTLIAQHNKNELVDGIKIIALPKPKNRIERIFLLTTKVYKLAIQEKAEIYHFHDPELLPWMLKLKNLTKTKIIYDIHENIAKQILSKTWIFKIFRKPLAHFFDIYEKRVSQKFDYLISATPNIRNHFKKHRIIDIKNYPIIDKISISKIDNGLKDSFNLIYVGGLEKIRGIKEIILSLKFINPKHNVKLTLIGKFSEKFFEKEIKKLSERNKVNFTGQLPQKQAYQKMQNADSGIVCFWPEPNHIAALPNKIFEYANAGLPIIASNFSLWKKIIENNKFGLCVNPLDPKEIAKAIEYLIENPEEAKKMGQNGHEAVLKKYNWKNEEKKLLSIYNELLK